MFSLWSSSTRAAVDIFVFHSIDVSVVEEKAWSTSVEKFKIQLDYIQENYNVLPVSETIDALHKRQLPSRNACITFDDGDPTWITNVAPELEARQLRATFYVATGQLQGTPIWHDRLTRLLGALRGPSLTLPFLGMREIDIGTVRKRAVVMDMLTRMFKYQYPAVRESMLLELEQFLGPNLPAQNNHFSADMVRELSRQGHEIGSHTVTHPILTFCDDHESWIEIGKSRDILSSITGAPVRSFSYPNGKPGIDFTEKHMNMVQRAGYTSAVSTAHGGFNPNVSMFNIPRFTPWGHTQFRMKLQILRNRLSKAPNALNQCVRRPIRVLIVENGTGFGGSVVALKNSLSGSSSDAITVRVVAPESYDLQHLPVVDSVFTATGRAYAGTIARIKKTGLLPVVLRQALSSLADDLYNRLPYFLFLLRNAIHFSPDLIHGNNELNANREALLVAKILRIPYVQHIRGPIGQSTSNTLIKNWPTAYICVSRWLYFSLLDLDIASRSMYQFYDALPSIQERRDSLEADAFRTRFGIPLQHRLIAMVGMLVPWKGQDLFIRAVALIRDRIAGSHFVIVGSAPTHTDPGYVRSLQALVKELDLEDVITFTGHIPDAERVMNNFAVTVSASLDPEPLGLVMIEALRAGCFFVGPAHGATAEVVGSNSNSCLFQPGSVTSLAEALITAYKFVSVEESMSRSSLYKIEDDQRFMLSNASNALSALYRSVL